MPWIGLVYSLPGSDASSRRVALWRRLRQLGAVAPTGSLYLLPPGDQHLEAFTWLAAEIEEGGGEAAVLRIERLEGGAEARAVERFRAARAEDYRKIAAEAEAARERAGRRSDAATRTERREAAERLRRRLAEVAQLDFFRAPEREEAASALARLEGPPAGERGAAPQAPRLDPASYRGRRWVTRPHPHVDRLACAWFIRRFLDPEARIRYGESARGREVPFDLPGADLGHAQGRCSFETMIAAFGFAGDPALAALGEIVHEVDLRDGASHRPETDGVAEILRGWAASDWRDADLERHGIALFEGLYEALQSTTQKGSPSPANPPKK